MAAKKQSKASIKIDRTSGTPGAANVTSFVQVKNSSRKDPMLAVDFAYEDSSGKKNRLRMTDQLLPQETTKIDFANLSLSIQVVSFTIAWQFQGIEYGSQVHTAKSGAYFYSMEVALRPDGSSESDFLVEKPISVE